MPKDAVQIKHTKRGMKKLIKNILLMQANYVSIGIHSSDNKESSGSERRRMHKKVQTALRKASKNNKDTEFGFGTDKTQGKSERSTGKTKQRINLATLAYYLEQPISWVQNKTISVQGVDGIVNIYKGARIHRPARIFIRIFKLPEVWNRVRSFIRMQVQNLLLRAGTQGKQFWVAIGTMTCNEQKGVIRTGHNAGNSDITTKIKGKNHPLFDTGRLLNSSTYKVRKNYSGKLSEAKVHFLAHLDEMMKQLG